MEFGIFQKAFSGVFLGKNINDKKKHKRRNMKKEGNI